MPSRRGFLATVGSAVVAGMAGCIGSASGGSDTVDCHTGALAHGAEAVLDTGVSATIEDDEVRLAVPLSVDDVRENDIDRLEVYDLTDALAYTIPTSANDADLMANKAGVNEGQLLYEQFLGHRPVHGQYRIVAVNTAGEPVDFISVDFNCFPDVSD